MALFAGLFADAVAVFRGAGLVVPFTGLGVFAAVAFRRGAEVLRPVDVFALVLFAAVILLSRGLPVCARSLASPAGNSQPDRSVCHVI